MAAHRTLARGPWAMVGCGLRTSSTIFRNSRSREVVVMRSIRLLALLTGVLLITGPLPGQNVNPMHPEEISVQKHTSPDDMRARAANVQLQKDAKELADFCASVPGDL